jgi:para-nitrobenzyl esterase
VELPVIVWFHEGGHVQGRAQSGSAPFDGQYFLEQFGPIVVTVDYRLNVLRYLAHPALDSESDQGVSGNDGLLHEVAEEKAALVAF